VVFSGAKQKNIRGKERAGKIERKKKGESA